jgi:L-alanine-DL-glutamate epimerase-like enolase superfamily enzyme
MRVAAVDLFTVNVPYSDVEVSAMVVRRGVTDILVRITTDDGLVGWGEACSGADVESVMAALRAMLPFVIGRSPWSREAMRAELYFHGLWQFRAPTANFAWAGIDMALWDLCGKAANLPLYQFFGGLMRQEVRYFYYLVRGSDASIAGQCQQGLAAGYEDFYLKVGVNAAADTAMIAAARAALGSHPRLRVDANTAWTISTAIDLLRRWEPYHLDFVEQPVRESPMRQMQEVRSRVHTPLAANEGLWTEAEAYERIRARVADVFCFSPYWVGSLSSFHRLAWVAHYEGLQVVKHTHGELDISAAACHHLLLTLPNVVTGHQQTAQHMTATVCHTPLPIASGPLWGVPQGSGLCIDINEAAVEAAAERYRQEGQYLPYASEHIGRHDHS